MTGPVTGPIIGSQQRDAVKILSPPWLATGTNEKFMYNLGLSSDGLLEKMNQAMRARMPGQGTYTALTIIGLDRVITQGPSEPNADFALRLQRAFPTWQLAGNRHAVLEQALVYMNGYQAVAPTKVPRGTIVGNSNLAPYDATWDTYYSDDDYQAPTNHVRVNPTNWNWDGNYLRWRAWLILFFEAGATIGAAPVFGAPGITIGGDENISIGLNVSSQVFVPLRSLLRLWKSAGTYYPYMILCFNGGTGDTGELLSPFSVQGAGNPDGTWGSHGENVGGVWVTTRPDDCRFVDGSGIYQNCSIHTGT